jgi:predicted transcriptional regulator of viral defense system
MILFESKYGVIMKNINDYLDSKTSDGKCFFTTQDLEKEMGLSYLAAKFKLLRLKEKKEIATPVRGFHLILSPEYRINGCLPASFFVPDLMRYLDLPYYVGLLSGAEIHGAAHQKPQVFQIIAEKNRKSIHCGRVKIDFIARQDMQKMPTMPIKTETGYLTVSTPEVTALDVANYPLRSGGTGNVVTVLEELAERLNEERLTALMPLVGATPQLQRLGFFLENVGLTALSEIVATELKTRRTDSIWLISKTNEESLSYNKKWKVKINDTWESDL